MPLIFFTIWFLIFFILFRRKSNYIYNPIIWLLMGWSLVFGLYFFSGIDYEYKLSLEAGAYFWAIFVSTFIGFKLSKKFGITLGKSKRKRIVPKINEFTSSTYKLYIGLSFAGGLFALLDILRLNSLSFDLHTSLNISGIGNIGILLSSIGLVMWLYECVRAITNNLRFRMSAFLGLGSYLLPGILTSGRQSSLIAVVSTIIILFYSFSRVKKYKYSIYIKAPVGIVAILLFLYTTVVSASRTAVSSKVALFEYMYACKLTDATANLLNYLGVFKTFVMEILFYYSHELSMFEVFWRYYDGPCFWGFSNLQLLSRNIMIEDNISIYDKIWIYLNALSNKAGVYGHVWRTASANCILDFGKVGGLIFALIIGYLLGRYYKKSIREKTVYHTVGLSLFCAGMFFAMQFSPICEAYWVYPIFWWLLLPFAERMLLKGKI